MCEFQKLCFMVVVVLLHFYNAHGFSKENLALAREAIEARDIDPGKVESAAEKIALELKANPKDEEGLAYMARLQFHIAVNEPDKKKRIEKYQKAIDTADEVIKLSDKNVMGHFWKASAMGKQGLDKGIMNALGNARPMEASLKRVIGLDEKYESGLAHQAIGRLYFELPGWPVSFGDNDKAVEHLRKAVEIGPDHLGHRVYLAQVLFKEDLEEEGKKHLEFFFAQKKDPKFPKEMAEYAEVAERLRKKYLEK